MTRPEMVSTRSLPPCAAAGILVNSMEGPRTSRRARQPLRRMQKMRRRSRSRALLFNTSGGGVFRFHSSNRRKQTCFWQGSKRVNSTLGGAVFPSANNPETVGYLDYQAILQLRCCICQLSPYLARLALHASHRQATNGCGLASHGLCLLWTGRFGRDNADGRRLPTRLET